MINKPDLGQRIAVDRSQPVLSWKRVERRNTLKSVTLASSGGNPCIGDMLVSLAPWLVLSGRPRGALRVADRPNRPQNTRLRHLAGIWVEYPPTVWISRGGPDVPDRRTQASQLTCLH